MEVKNCRNCKRLFNYMGGGYLLCPACMDELEKKFIQVRDYIRENPKASMTEISDDNEVSTSQIERWIREERLTFTDDSPIGLECENCGVTIHSGRYCQKCKDAMAKGLDNAFKRHPDPKPDPREAARERARMRFLDNQ